MDASQGSPSGVGVESARAMPEYNRVACWTAAQCKSMVAAHAGTAGWGGPVQSNPVEGIYPVQI